MCAAPILLIRADASVSIGTGHIMRMIALGQAWQDTGGRVIFLCAQVTPPLEQRIFDENFQLEKLAAILGDWDDLAATSAAITRHVSGGQSVAVALDGYHFDANFQLGLRETGCRLMVVDDYGHAVRYPADLVLNQNVSAREELYAQRSSDTRLLMGPKFALLRREFSSGSGWDRVIPDKAQKLLVTMGGSDMHNVTEMVIHAVAASGLEVKVAVGGSNPHLPSLHRAIEAVSGTHTRVDLVVNTSDMLGLMKWADVAVAAGGSTSWELAFAGLPALFITLAANQEQSVRDLEKEGFGICLGGHSKLDTHLLSQTIDRLVGDSALRARFAVRGTQMVDGRGAQRVVSFLSNSEALDFRPVKESDFELLWQWVNDPVTRANSFESAAIPWEQHKTWCQSKLNDPGCIFWMVASAPLGKAGTVRFDCADGEAIISVSLAPHARGRGYGKTVITAACARLFESSPLKVVRAFIKPANQASVRAFERAGFRLDKKTMNQNLPARQYSLYRASC